MNDQAEAVESEEYEAPEDGQAEDLEEVEDVENSDDSEDESGEPEEPEYVKVEIDGQEYEVPAGLKDKFMMQSDYTKKTQEVAEARKAFEQQQAEWTQQQTALQQSLAVKQQNLQGYAQLASVDAQLQQFQQIDWNTLIEENPVEAQKLQFQRNQLAEMRDGLANNLSQAEQALQSHQAQQMAEMARTGREQLKKEIDGWSPELAKDLRSYGTTLGFQEAEVASILDPRQVKVLHKAYLYDQLLSKAKSSVEGKAKPKPTKRVRSGKTPQKDPNKMSDKEWYAWREKQRAKKRGY